MNRIATVIVMCLIVGGLGIFLWRTFRDVDSGAVPVAVAVEKAPLVVAAPPTQAAPIEVAPAEPVVEASVTPEPAPEPEVVVTPPEPVAEQPLLTAETLAGTKWKEDKVDFEFMADGRWQMNGRICAKWAVEGDRVKVFDDKGEAHYFEIVGDTLAFNGKKLGKAPL